MTGTKGVHHSGIKVEKKRSGWLPFSPRVRVGLFGITGAGLIAAGAIIFVYFPVLVKYIIEQKLILAEGSQVYKIWQNPTDMGIELHFYFFNISNPENLGQNGSKPIVRELGPYVYDQKWEKINITWHPNGTVSYLQKKTFHFIRERSIGDDSDIIYMLNVPMLNAAAMFKYVGVVLKMVLQTVLTLTEANLIIKVAVKDIIFDGYDDPLIKMYKEVMPNAPYPYPLFAFLYGRNGSTDGVYTIGTGENDIHEFSKMFSWNGRSKLDNWYDSHCGMINGTNGEGFSPDLDTSKQLDIFAPDLCRSFRLDYTGPVEHYGLDGVRYELTAKSLANATENPDNWCFCDGDCLPSGVFNITRCKWEAPVVASLPHFYLADPRYVEQIEGIHPDEELHRLFLDVEPTTGIPLKVALRSQVNVIVEKMEGVALLENIENSIFPIMWFAQMAHLNEEGISLLKLATKDSHVYGKLLYSGSFASGAFLLLVAFLYYMFLTKRTKTKPFTRN